GVGVKTFLAQDGMRTAKSGHSPGEPVNVLMPFEAAPVIPARFVVLAIGIVVSALRAAELVAAHQHRYAARDEQGQQEIPDLALAYQLDAGIFRRALDAVILAEILVAAVAAAFAVRFIVLAAITNEVVKRESIVAGDEIDASFRAFAGPREDIGTSGDTAGECAEHCIVAAPETTHIVAIATVPLQPVALEKTAHLVGARGIPRLGDELGTSQNGILGDPLDEWRIGEQIAVAVAAEYRRQVEPEAIHVHFHDPVAQRGEDVFPHRRMVGVDSIAGARIILVMALVVGQRIEGRVIDAAKT